MQTILRLALLALVFCPRTASAAEDAKKLNVVVILADDLGAVDLGCYGSTFHKTPNLDRLAASGIRFTTGYAACNVCSPTRAALLTGQYPARLGITDWLTGRPDRPDQQLARPKLVPRLPESETTLATAFKSAGYSTGLIGKWHLGGEADNWPKKHGFDVAVGISFRKWFAPFPKSPGLEKAPAGEYLTDRLATEAETFLDNHKDTPFFLYLAHFAPHVPMQAKKEIIAKYSPKRIPGRQSNAICAAMIESLDDAVGRVIKKLETLKLTDRTLIVFTSDNGGLSVQEGPNTPATTNAPYREGKGWLYEGGHRVPWIVKWPGVVKPGTSKVPIISNDLYPTLAEACGLKAKTTDGVSFVSLLKGGEAPKRDTLYWHYPHYSNQGGKPGGAIRAGNYKLIEHYETGRLELFDVEKDKSESQNLSAREPERVKKLAAQLATWRKSVGAKMPTPNPDYVPNPPNAKGVITLQAKTAQVHGTQLRYEPAPHKFTLGYWTEVNDYATWSLTVPKPGKYRVGVMQGCGTGQGGSVIELGIGDKKLTMTVKDTGGFQNWEVIDAGIIAIEKPGRHTFTVKPKTKAKSAIMDIREIRLTPE